MTHPKTYLLMKIVGHRDNGLNSLGHLHAKHVEDIVAVMESFAIESIENVIERLNKGESIQIGDKILSIEINRSKKKTTKTKHPTPSNG
jgi:hypothetical protein